MNVISLLGYANKESRALLKALLHYANMGELDGMAVCFKLKDGTERTAFVGSYKDSPDKGLCAALRMSKTLMDAHEDRFQL